MKLFRKMLLVGLTLTTAAQVAATEVRNGGDVVQAEFLSIGREIHARLSIGRPAALRRIDLDAFKTALDRIIAEGATGLVTVEGEPTAQGSRDFKDAVNITGDIFRIEISRPRWERIKNYSKKVMLVAHELLVISGQADKDYSISSYFLTDIELSSLIQTGVGYQMRAGQPDRWLCYNTVVRQMLKASGADPTSSLSDQKIDELVEIFFTVRHFAAWTTDAGLLLRQRGYRLYKLQFMNMYLGNAPDYATQWPGSPWMTLHKRLNDLEARPLGWVVDEMLANGTKGWRHTSWSFNEVNREWSYTKFIEGLYPDPESRPRDLVDWVGSYYRTHGAPVSCKGVLFASDSDAADHGIKPE